jgi:hypothetical protein
MQQYSVGRSRVKLMSCPVLGGIGGASFKISLSLLPQLTRSTPGRMASICQYWSALFMVVFVAS